MLKNRNPAFFGSLAVILVLLPALLIWKPWAEAPNQRDATMALFEEEGCASCHGFTQTGAFGLNRQGQALAQGFEGCGPMLDVIKESLVIEESQWTQEHKRARTNFGLFGCASCHQLSDKTVELTKIGAQAGDLLHKGCVDMCCPKGPGSPGSF